MGVLARAAQVHKLADLEEQLIYKGMQIVTERESWDPCARSTDYNGAATEGGTTPSRDNSTTSMQTQHNNNIWEGRRRGKAPSLERQESGMCR